MIRKLIFPFIFLAGGHLGFGQQIYGQPDAWFMLLNHYKLSERWVVGNEWHVRRNDWLSQQEQLLIRPFATFNTESKVGLTAGYTYIKTSPYGEYPLPIALPEHNVWEQITIGQKIKNITVSHRYRMEHRFRGTFMQNAAGDYVTGDYQFANRFRYRITTRKPLNEHFFVQAFDEVWLNFTDRFLLSGFDRNWFYAGLGWSYLPNANVQLGYMHQWIQRGPNYEKHPTLQLVLQYDLARKQETIR
ncbi:MAG: DUF2490 domain-containing protein [Cyclobacteriaceae bacterium]|nr:DUF2490 domain-containing protein [Cyclobacteriaceae bacterium]